MDIPFRPAAQDASDHRTNAAGRWLFWVIGVFLVAVLLLLPILSLTIYSWRINQRLALIKRLEAGPYLVMEDEKDLDSEGSWLEKQLGERWQFPRVGQVVLVQPFAPNSTLLLDEIAQLDELQSMSFAGAALDDAGLDQLASLRKLKSVDLTATDVTNVALARLAQWPELEELDLSATNVTDQEIARLATLSSLRSLRLRNTIVSPEAVQGLRQLRPDLEIHYSEVKSPEHVAAVRAVTKRGGGMAAYASDLDSTLVINGESTIADWNGFDWKQLRNLSGIRVVRVVRFDQPGDVLLSLADFSLVTHLSLDYCPVDWELMAHIATCPDLRLLELRHCNLGSEHIKLLGQVKSLERLTLGNIAVDASGLSVIGSLPSLDYLELYDCKFAPGVFSSAVFPPKLKSLGLFKGNVTDVDLQHIAKCQSLRELTLIGTQITDVSIDTLVSMPNLTRAAVGATAVTYDGEQRLEEALRQRQEQQAATRAEK